MKCLDPQFEKRALGRNSSYREPFHSRSRDSHVRATLCHQIPDITWLFHLGICQPLLNQYSWCQIPFSAFVDWKLM